MAIQILGDGNPEGSSTTSAASEKSGEHGSAAVQGSAITTMATIPTTLTDGTISVRLNTLIGKFNSLVNTIRSKGTIAP